MQLHSLDHVHFSVPDLTRAKQIFGPWLPGVFTPTYGDERQNAFGTWNMSGGDFIQVLDRSRPVFGASLIPDHGILSISFRVMDVDLGIKEALGAGLRLRSRVGSEDIGLGKNVIQAQFHPGESFGLGIELVEREIPGDPHLPMTQTCVDHVEHIVADLEAPRAFLTRFLDSTFEPVVEDEELGARSVRNARFGVQLTAPSDREGVVGRQLAARGPWLRAIAFRSGDLDADVVRAQGAGLELVRRREIAPGVREAEFAEEAGLVLKLVERVVAASAFVRGE